MSEQKKNKYNVSAKQTYKRTLSRKNAKTGKSNYPTMTSKKQTTVKYENGKKEINNSNYRKIEND